MHTGLHQPLDMPSRSLKIDGLVVAKLRRYRRKDTAPTDNHRFRLPSMNAMSRLLGSEPVRKSARNLRTALGWCRNGMQENLPSRAYECLSRGVPHANVVCTTSS